MQSKPPKGMAAGLGARLRQALFGGGASDAQLHEALETLLLTADVGLAATQAILAALPTGLQDRDAAFDALKAALVRILQTVEAPLLPERGQGPFVILMLGVNGAGKTTTIGKLASRWLAEGRTVMLAAGDTFRAAAVEQLEAWGQRLGVPVIAQGQGADAASVCYDALAAAKARQVDLLIADTAGRLQNKRHLMDELGKVVRVMQKLDGDAPQETLLALDAGTGQNALSQVAEFSAVVPVTGLALTKLDGSAKGGVALALAQRFGIPIRYLGVGEGAEDLRDFCAQDFAEALLG